MRYLILLMGLVVALGGVVHAAAAPELVGTVVDAAGEPLAAEVEVYRLDVGLMGVMAVGTDGVFRYPGVVEIGSLWQLRVWAKGFRMVETEWFDPSARGPVAVRLSPMMGSLQVRVIDGDGGVVSGTVTLVGPGGAVVWEHSSERVLRSDAVAGEYRVVVASPGSVPVSRPVTVVAGSTARVLVVLSPSLAVLDGQVRDAVTGAPLGAAVVEVLAPGGRTLAAGVTAGSGEFSLGAAPVGDETYQVRVSAPGYRPAISDGLALRPGDRRDWSGGDAFSLSPVSATITGVVQDAFGGSRAHQRVVLVLKGYGEVGATNATESGRFEFADVATGPGLQYRVIAEWTGDAVDSGWLTLRPGGTTQLPLRSRGGASDSFGLGVLTGEVTSPAGAPLPGAKVELLRRGSLLRSVETDGVGAFTMRDLPATQGPWAATDPYAIRISKDGYWAAREVTLDGKSTVDVPVQFQGWSQVQAVLQPLAAALRGRVLDLDGRPVAGATVELFPEGGARLGRVRTNAQGWYSLQVTPKPGFAYSLHVSAEGYIPIAGMDVSAGVRGGSGLPTVRLASASSVFAGQVLDPDGRGISGVSVAVRGPGGEDVASVVTDEQGLYQVAAVVPRSRLTTVTARRDGWTAALAEVPDPPGAGGRVVRDLVLFPATTVVEGRVTSPDGTLVDLLAEGQGVIASTLTRNGAYRFDSVPASAGWVWVRVHRAVD